MFFLPKQLHSFCAPLMSDDITEKLPATLRPGGHVSYLIVLATLSQQFGITKQRLHI